MNKKKKKKRYSEHSIHNTNMKRVKKLLHDHRGKWDNEKADILLEDFLAGKKWLSARDCHLMKVGRTSLSVPAHLWKLAAMYRDEKRPTRSQVIYTPVDRRDRTGEPFSIYDRCFMRMACTPKAIRMGAYKPERIALLLGRKVLEVSKYIMVLTKRAVIKMKGFGLKPKDAPEVQIAKALYEVLK